MEKRWTVLVVMAALGALLIAEGVLAAPAAPTNLVEGVGSRRDLTGIPAQTVDAVAGNVTQVDISAIAITKSWQGYYGNVSGTIILADASNNTFYNWTVASAKGEIYATRTGTPSWATVTCTNSTQIATEETALGQVAADADSVSNTYLNTATHPAFTVATTNIVADACYATNAFDATGAQTTNFHQLLLSEAGGNIVYTTIVNGTQTGFNSAPWDFELLVGEDGHGNTATTTYYFWVELN